MNKCIKLAIYPNDKILSPKQINTELFALSKQIRKVSNKVMTLQYLESMRKLEPDAVDARTLYGKGFLGHIYDELCKELTTLQTANTSALQSFIQGKQVFDFKKILRGEEVLSTFRSDMPIFLHNNSFNIKENNGNYDVDISLFNRAKCKELNCKRIVFSFFRVDDYAKAILNRLISKEYKQGSGQIIYNRRKNKWMLVISFSFAEQTKELNENRTLGVDLGIVKTATLAVYDKEKGYVKTSWKERFVDGTELIHFRQKIEARRKALSVASKWSSNNKTGHGYKHRMQDANALSNKAERFKDTYNHKVSKYIVDMAIKYNCASIQMENLSGFSNEQTESFLQSWSYFDLQQKVLYKAKEHGIEVNFINPKYTSKRCSKCGCIHEDNRDCKNNQAKFKCVNCGFEMNADENAARNIALPNIENIISETITV